MQHSFEIVSIIVGGELLVGLLLIGSCGPPG
jgi:hypothetical protein